MSNRRIIFLILGIVGFFLVAGIGAVVLIGSYARKSLEGFIEEAKLERVKSDIALFGIAIKGYERGNDFNPPNQEQGLNALVERPSSDPQPERWRPYIGDQKALIDPWGNRYQYRIPAQTSKEGYDIWSLGEDGVESDDDIGNWE